MMLDDDLRRRLATAADALEVADPPIARMASRGRRRARVRIAGASLLTLALLGSAGVLGWTVTGAGRDRVSLDAAPQGVPAMPSPAAGDDFEEQAAYSDSDQVTLNSWTSTSGEAAPVPAPKPAGAGAGAGKPAAGPRVSPRIVKSASVKLRVEDGDLSDSIATARRIAARHRGFVVSSKTGGRDGRSGKLTIRVPVRAFDGTLDELRALGVVEVEEIGGQDVTSDYVDLHARLRHWEAQEDALLALMAEASTIGETLTVQNELRNAQLEIEKLRGQLRVLRDQADLSSITVAMHEPGAGPKPRTEDESGPLAAAWGRAVRGAETGVAAIVVGLGTMLPFMLLFALLWFAVRAVRSRTA